MIIGNIDLEPNVPSDYYWKIYDFSTGDYWDIYPDPPIETDVYWESPTEVGYVGFEKNTGYVAASFSVVVPE